MHAYRDLRCEKGGEQWLRLVCGPCGLVVLLAIQAYASEPPARLVVGTMHTPPFAIHADDGHWSGFSIDLLRQMAETLGFEIEWREYDYDLYGLLYAVEHWHLDAAIAALPMTAPSKETVDFSHAYFRTGLGMAVGKRPPQPMFAIMQGFFSWQFLAAGLIDSDTLARSPASLAGRLKKNPSQYCSPRPPCSRMAL
jgi:ABC-type amino acid transport substrate-binding protein